MPDEDEIDEDQVYVMPEAYERWWATYNAALTGLLADGGAANPTIDAIARKAAYLAHGFRVPPPHLDEER